MGKMEGRGAVGDGLSCKTSRVRKPESIHNIIEPLLELPNKHINGTLANNTGGLLHVAFKLRLTNAVGKASLLLFNKLASIIASPTATTAVLTTFCRTRLTDQILLCLEFLKHSTTESFTNFISWSDLHIEI